MWINIIVDVIIAGILIAGAVIGIKRGLILSLAKPLKWIGSLVSAFSLSGVFAEFVVQPMIQAPLTNHISKYLAERCGDITAATANDKLPTLLKLAAGAVGVDITAIEGETSGEFIISLIEKLAVPTIHLIALIISFIALNIIFKILLNLLFWLIDSLFKAGLFGFVNKSLGFVLNTAFAFVIAWGLTALFAYFISLPGVADFAWAANFKGGFLYQFFKNIDPIDLLLSF